MSQTATFEPGCFAEPWHRMLDGFRGLEHRVLGAAARRRWERHPVLADVQVRSCGHYIRARDHRWRRRGLGEGVLITCTGGRGWYRRGTREWAVVAGDLLWCPPGTVHAYGAAAADPWSILWMHLTGSAVSFLAAQAGFTDDIPVMHLGVHPILVAAMREVVALTRPDPDDATMMATQASARRVVGLAAVLPRMRTLPSASDRAVASAQRILAEAPDEPFDLRRLAAAVGLSAAHLSRSFRAATGSPPRLWLMQVRIRQACRLLGDDRLSMAEMAQRLGFSDQYHFSRSFRRCMGVSPSAWRDAQLRPRVAQNY